MLHLYSYNVRRCIVKKISTPRINKYKNNSCIWLFKEMTYVGVGKRREQNIAIVTFKQLRTERIKLTFYITSSLSKSFTLQYL